MSSLDTLKTHFTFKKSIDNSSNDCEWFSQLISKSPNITVSEVEREDWGWRVSTPGDSVQCWIGLGSYPKGQHESWLAFCELPVKPWFAFFVKVQEFDVQCRALELLLADVKAVLERDPLISNVECFTYEEFNGTKRP